MCLFVLADQFLSVSYLAFLQQLYGVLREFDFLDDLEGGEVRCSGVILLAHDHHAVYRGPS